MPPGPRCLRSCSISRLSPMDLVCVSTVVAEENVPSPVAMHAITDERHPKHNPSPYKTARDRHVGHRPLYRRHAPLGNDTSNQTSAPGQLVVNADPFLHDGTCNDATASRSRRSAVPVPRRCSYLCAVTSHGTGVTLCMECHRTLPRAVGCCCHPQFTAFVSELHLSQLDPPGVTTPVFCTPVTHYCYHYHYHWERAAAGIKLCAPCPEVLLDEKRHMPADLHSRKSLTHSA
jgi:hypothetical protein